MAYQAVIGLELHCELKSKSKVFSNAVNGYSDIANSNIRPLDLGLPGTLPTLNIRSMEEAIKLAICLKCQIPKEMKFDRKNYFYPDLPKGYQITQQTSPVGINGEIIVECNGEAFPIRIHDIHLEEDSASLDHISNISLIDYNRSGVPLIEIVTEPCIYSWEQAVAFLEQLRYILKYTEISDVDTKKGQLRCDVNISLRYEGDYNLGTKVEIKNVNSFSNVREAIIYEINRQTKLFDDNHQSEIIQETRRFDEETGTTISMREKIEAIDYNYYLEPNIPFIEITDELKLKLKNEIPLLPNQRKKLYRDEYDLSEEDINVLIKDKDISDFFQECIKLAINPQAACNYITTTILSFLNKYKININDIFLTPIMLKEIINKLNNKEISSKQAKEIINDVIELKKDPMTIFNESNISQISNDDVLLNIIIKILDNNLQQIIDFKNGKNNLFDFFVGQVMKETKGQANPSLTKELITSELEKR